MPLVGAPLPGRLVIGFKPKTGMPRDADGQLILEWVYACEPRNGPAKTTAVVVDEFEKLPKQRQSLLL